MTTVVAGAAMAPSTTNISTTIGTTKEDRRKTTHPKINTDLAQDLDRWGLDRAGDGRCRVLEEGEVCHADRCRLVVAGLGLGPVEDIPTALRLVAVDRIFRGLPQRIL